MLRLLRRLDTHLRHVKPWARDWLRIGIPMIAFVALLCVMFGQDPTRDWITALSGWVIGIGALVFAYRQIKIMATQNHLMAIQAQISARQNELADIQAKSSATEAEILRIRRFTEDSTTIAECTYRLNNLVIADFFFPMNEIRVAEQKASEGFDHLLKMVEICFRYDPLDNWKTRAAISQAKIDFIIEMRNIKTQNAVQGNIGAYATKQLLISIAPVFSDAYDFITETNKTYYATLSGELYRLEKWKEAHILP